MRRAGSQRSVLMDAACALLTETSRLPTLQQTARRAGVTTALAHYYFAHQEGLLEALILERVQPRLDELAKGVRLRAGQPATSLAFLLQRLGALMQSEPVVRWCLWLQTPAGHGLRAQLRRVGEEMVALAQKEGRLRRDLETGRLAESLLGLALFPFVDAHHGVEDAAGAARLTLHQVALLQDGVLRAHSPRQESSA